ncbi:MAG: hypothetical protein ACFFAN_07650 [Promethearchaeota archaeon]
MQEVKGTYILMIVHLLSEYNPEILEKSIKEMSIDIKSIDPEEWYDRKEVVPLLKNLSPDAIVAVAKNVYPTLKATTNYLDGIDDPVEMIKTMVPQYRENHRGERIGEYKILDSGPDFIKIKRNTGFPPQVDEGIIRGILGMFKIVKVHIKTTVENVKWNYPEITFNVKWD